MTLEYLTKYKNYIDWDDLTKIIDKRNQLPLAKRETPFHHCLDNLPSKNAKHINFDGDILEIGKEKEITSNDKQEILKSMATLMPWRKGPYNLFGIDLDGEWRSEQKWNRMKDALPGLTGKKILDIGCNNGWYMFKMASHNPELILGIDPVIRCYYQFHLLKHFSSTPSLHYELLGIEDIKHFHNLFDVIFNMGIIYHHQDPIGQLLQIKEALVPGGTAIIETIGIPGDEHTALCPPDRYAQMKNIFFIPTVNCLTTWLTKAKFKNIQVISSTILNSSEQRVTKWCPNKSLKDFLDPTDNSKTIEGHPAPIRFAIKAQRPAQ